MLFRAEATKTQPIRDNEPEGAIAIEENESSWNKKYKLRHFNYLSDAKEIYESEVCTHDIVVIILKAKSVVGCGDRSKSRESLQKNVWGAVTHVKGLRIEMSISEYKRKFSKNKAAYITYMEKYLSSEVRGEITLYIKSSFVKKMNKLDRFKAWKAPPLDNDSGSDGTEIDEDCKPQNSSRKIACKNQLKSIQD